MSSTRRNFVLSLTTILLATNVHARSGESHTWTHGDDWIARIAYEARAAFHAPFAAAHADMPHKVESSQLPPSYENLQGAKAYLGTVNYVYSDMTAYSMFYGETVADKNGLAGGPYTTSDGKTYYAGGECTFFAGLVLLRSTYWAWSDHYATPNFPGAMYGIPDSQTTQAWSTVQPGWVLVTKGGADGPHYAVVERAGKADHSDGTPTGLWIIDSNYVYQHGIGYHFIPFSVLNARNYRAWKPNRGTYNY